jgi:hypothetical protein
MAAVSLGAIEAAVRQSWRVETCDPIDVPNWTVANPSRGQCAVTALVVRDLLGGELLEAEVHYPNGERQGFHYWNRLPGLDLDLTADQFKIDELVQEPRIVEGPPTVSWIVDEQYALYRRLVYEALGLPTS